VTVKYWGGDSADTLNDAWRQQIFVDGKSLGWLDQSHVDNIDNMGVGPRLPGRFYCHTLPLPTALTADKTSLDIEIRAMGRIHPYGNDIDNSFYWPLTEPSRPVYRAYTHTDPHFVPASDDAFGSVGTPATRANTDDERIAQVRARVLKDQANLLYGQSGASMDYYAFTTLLQGFYWADSPAYRDPTALEKVCQAFDSRYLAWLKDPKVLSSSEQQWEGFGRIGNGLTVAWDDIQESLDRNVTSGPTSLPNLGFEGGSGSTLYGWGSPGWASNGTFSRDTNVYRGGKASLKIASSGGSMLVTSASRALTGQGTLTYSCWVKTDGIAKTPHVLVQFYDDANAYVSGSKDIYPQTGTTDWQQITGTVTVPAKATHYEFWLTTQAGETAYFDDVEIIAPEPSAGTPVPRRKAYRDMLVASRDYWRQHNRHYTNQCQFTSIGIYECNRGLALLSPADAWTEAKAKTFLYQAVGLEPWAGSQDAAGNWTWPLGHDYYIVTPKGLSRELGFVAGYGETSGMLARIYAAVSGGKGGAEDPELRARMIEMVKAHARFRHPAVDADGNRTVRVESQIGWRNEDIPGEMCYSGRTDWDSSPIAAAAALGDPDLVAYVQQMIDDGQLAPQLDLFTTTNLYSRVGLNAYNFLVTHLPALKKVTPSSARVPAGTWDTPDYVFADETNGCLAVKRGEELFFTSLYYRARQGVNDLARVHLLTPQSERSALVREKSVFRKSSTKTFTVQDWVCWDFAVNDPARPNPLAGGYTPPGPALHQAFAGETQYLAPVPADVPDPALGSTTLGVETVLVGKAPFYILNYAGYTVAMNTTTDQTFSFTPDCTSRTTDLVTGRKMPGGRPLKVGPQKTVVLFDPTKR
ncbi:Tat pathway signal sequence domain protein, partial [Streptomyces sp. NPDC002920]